MGPQTPPLLLPPSGFSSLLLSTCGGAGARTPVHGWPAAPADQKRPRNHQREGFGWGESELRAGFVDGGSEGCGRNASERLNSSQALGALRDARRLRREVCAEEQAENVRNVRVGWFFRHAGTACGVLPREIWRCVPCKRYRGERREGGKRQRERDGCVCVCMRVCEGGVFGQGRQKVPRGFSQ